MVMDLFVLRRIVEERVISHLDHRHLDRDVPQLAGQLSTLENLGRVIWRQLEGAVHAPGGPSLHRVTLAESSQARVSFTAE
jgi:6-pyruvoyltetrahydropterin/6-carboxytetrahydropterin synthase